MSPEQLQEIKDRARKQSATSALRTQLQSHDCTYGDTPGLIHCPLDKPCTTHQLESAKAALRLLWEEATDNERCSNEVAGGLYQHHISEPCRAAVKSALGEERDQDFLERLRKVLGIPEVVEAYQQGAREMRERAAQTAFEMRGVPADPGRKIESAILELPLLEPPTKGP